MIDDHPLATDGAVMTCAVDRMAIISFDEQRDGPERRITRASGYLIDDICLRDRVRSAHSDRSKSSPISGVVAQQLMRQLQRNPELSEANPNHLSQRELDVLRLIASGFSYKEMARTLSLSVHTIGTYIKRIYRKLEVNSRAEATFRAITLGMINGG
jgi:DNA-binding NarL/FixJ family response regulator